MESYMSMTILHWNLIFLFIYAFLLVYRKGNKTKDKIFIILVTIQFLFINGFRHFSVGTDSVVYYWKFNEAVKVRSIIEVFKLHRYEPGYTMLEFIIGSFTQNYAVFFVICAIIIFVPLGIFIYRNSTNYFLSYFIYIVLRMFDFSMNGVRQSMAISISLFAFEFAMRKDLKKFLMVVIVASLFHYSAIIILPIYFIVNHNFKKIHLVFLGAIYSILYLSKDFIARIFIEIYYRSNPEIMSTYEPTNIGMTGLFILFVLLIGGVIHNPFDERSSKKTRALFYITIATFFIHSFSTYSYLFKRLNYFYLIYLIIYLPELINESKTLMYRFNTEALKKIQLGIMILLVISLTAYYFSIINNDYFGLLPYGTFYEQFEYELDRFK